MQYNTIVNNNENEKENFFDKKAILNKVPEQAGLFYTTGETLEILRGAFNTTKHILEKSTGELYTTVIFNLKSNCVLHIGIADVSLLKKINSVLTDTLDNSYYKYKVNSINYVVIHEKELRDRVFLSLFKEFKPQISYIHVVSRSILKHIMENERKLANGKRREKFLEEKLGDLSRFTRDISEDSIFKKFDKGTINKQAKEESGIYFLYNENKELMYIGKAKNLKSRLLEHLSGKTNTREVCHNFKNFKSLYMANILTKDYEIYFINTYMPLLNEDGVLTYVSLRFDKRYNSIVRECGSFKEYLRLQEAKQISEGWLMKGYFDEEKTTEIFARDRKVHWTIDKLLTRAKLPYPKGVFNWKGWDKQTLDKLKRGESITYTKEDFVNQGIEWQQKIVEELEFKIFTIYREV